MKYKIKDNWLLSFLERYEKEIVSLNFSGQQATLIFKEEPIINVLFPFFFSQFKKDLNRDFFAMRDGLDPVRKNNEEGNTWVLTLNEPIDEARSILVRDLEYELIESFKLLRENLDIIIEGTNQGETLIIQGQAFPIEWFDETQAEAVTCKVCARDEWREIRRQNPQVNQIKYYAPQGFCFWDGPEQVFFVLLKNSKVIGLSECYIDKKQNSLVSKYSSIIESEQGKGYSRMLLEAKVNYAKSENLNIHNSSYTNQGFYKLRPVILNLCDAAGVGLKEEGLFNSAETLPEEIFKIQNEIKKELEICKQINKMEIYIPRKYQRLNIEQERGRINRFLNLNPYDFDDEQKIKQEWNFLMFFLEEDFAKKILNKE